MALKTAATGVFQEALLLSRSSFEIVFIEGLGVVLRVQRSRAKRMCDALVGPALESLQMRNNLATEPRWEPVGGCWGWLGCLTLCRMW